MQRCLLYGLGLLAMRLLCACAPAGSFDADSDRCQSQAIARSPSVAEDYRLPEAVDETAAARVTPAPKETSSYALCMRSRGWKLDREGKAVDKGLSAEEYSKVVAEDLMICVHGSGEESPSQRATKAVGSSAARVVCVCLEEKATSGITSVDLNLVIGEGGTIRRATAQPESPVATCLRDTLPGTAVAEPPSAPWKATVRILHYQ